MQDKPICNDPLRIFTISILEIGGFTIVSHFPPPYLFGRLVVGTLALLRQAFYFGLEISNLALQPLFFFYNRITTGFSLILFLKETPPWDNHHFVHEKEVIIIP